MSKYDDIAFMQMAYGLAEKAIGWTSPNPNVGAVVVKKGKVAGSGWHERPGKPHAEVIALKQAGQLSRGATIYITLEPCTHWGRTPPCVGELLNSQLDRAVISAYDPNPVVHKKGVTALRQAGISVTTGLLEEKNNKLNAAYRKYITQKLPYITLKTALSLDGKSATRSLDSQWISMPETREYIHLLRGEHDAVLVGIQTLLQDNPRLTARHPHWKGKPLLRVILDTRLRFPEDARMLKTLDRGGILIATASGVDPQKVKRLENRGVEVLPLKPAGKNLNLSDLLSCLGERKISSLLVEGGGTVHSAFLDAGLADRILVTLSPKLIGGAEAPAFYQGRGVDRLKDSLKLKDMSTFRIGEDLVVEGYF